jgi:uncharacterized protein YdeI (YjbR/CyaY-like superfamily)
MHHLNPKVDAYLSEANQWQTELQALRTIVLDCFLTEEWKWRVPCYTFQNSNIVLLNGLKDYCAIGFFKGALLKDANHILVQQTAQMQAVRLIRFTHIREIMALENVLKTYIYEAIEVEKAGLKVAFKTVSEFDMPEEFQLKLAENTALKTAFDALTPGRQKAYLLFFSAPVQSKTRETRIEKHIQQILCGKGLNDCTCGLSKKMPQCDGSHKFI